MATKTISIDVQAYERLAKAKREGESFSEVIKRIVPRPVDLDAWFREMDANPLSRRTVRAVEEVVRRRSRKARSG
jgi:predicted CopG family antitoxin